MKGGHRRDRTTSRRPGSALEESDLDTEDSVLVLQYLLY
jgi:hypothetical protein